ncbi:MAG: hypothetical protein H6721_23545 [Sandaracinus sp.]|nr:hypothetical protein [Sandaracinus sp.]MCB9635111.1 hypothetical protein [Sandaracinus sp.]
MKDDRDGKRGRKNPPARSGSTIQGMPAVDDEGSGELSLDIEPARKGSEPALSIEWSPESRITMDFTGPPLELPDEIEEEEPRSPSEAAPLSLDLEELDGEGDALGLVEATNKSQPGLDLASEMAERYALDDFTGALRIAELVLGRDAEHPDARRIAAESRRRLEALYTSRLGGVGWTPSVALPDADLRWLGLDHRAGFLLSRVDGHNTIEDLVDISGMPRLEALKTLVELLDVGAIRLGR